MKNLLALLGLVLALAAPSHATEGGLVLRANGRAAVTAPLVSTDVSIRVDAARITPVEAPSPERRPTTWVARCAGSLRWMHGGRHRDREPGRPVAADARHLLSADAWRTGDDQRYAVIAERVPG